MTYAFLLNNRSVSKLQTPFTSWTERNLSQKFLPWLGWGISLGGKCQVTPPNILKRDSWIHKTENGTHALPQYGLSISQSYHVDTFSFSRVYNEYSGGLQALLKVLHMRRIWRQRGKTHLLSHLTLLSHLSVHFRVIPPSISKEGSNSKKWQSFHQ